VARSADRLQIPAFAADRRGNFVVAWAAARTRAGGGGGILARRFDRHGLARGPQFDVNTITAGTQSDAAVAMERGGNFVVIWTGDRSDGQGPGVYGQRYRRDGSLRGGEFQVNSRRAGEGSAPGVNVHPTGGFVVTWPSGSSAAWARAPVRRHGSPRRGRVRRRSERVPRIGTAQDRSPTRMSSMSVASPSMRVR
jgi:hypothetical protein